MKEECLPAKALRSLQKLRRLRDEANLEPEVSPFCLQACIAFCERCMLISSSSQECVSLILTETLVKLRRRRRDQPPLSQEIEWLRTAKARFLGDASQAAATAAAAAPQTAAPQTAAPQTAAPQTAVPQTAPAAPQTAPAALSSAIPLALATTIATRSIQPTQPNINDRMTSNPLSQVNLPPRTLPNLERCTSLGPASLVAPHLMPSTPLARIPVPFCTVMPYGQATATSGSAPMTTMTPITLMQMYNAVLVMKAAAMMAHQQQGGFPAQSCPTAT